MFIPDPEVYPSGSRIPDPKKQQKRGVKKTKLVVIPFLCSHKFHKIVNYSIFEMLKKKFWANFQRIIKLFTQKLAPSFPKIWVWDQGSGKNLFRIPDPGVKKAPDPGSGSATLDFRAPPTTKQRKFKFLGETDVHKNVPDSIFSFYWHCLIIFFRKSVLYRSHPSEHYKLSELLVSTRSKKDLSIGRGINKIIFPSIKMCHKKVNFVKEENLAYFFTQYSSVQYHP
jgi:hypothetical protein